MNATTHPFEHLGPAPYRVIGVETTADREARNGALRGSGRSYTTNMCGGTCAHCSTAIWNVYTIECADGTRHKVGSTCVEKAAKASGDRVLARDAKDRKRVIDRKARARRKAAKVAKELAERPAKVAALWGDNHEWTELLDMCFANGGYARSVSKVMRAQVFSGRGLSERQVAFLGSLRDRVEHTA